MNSARFDRSGGNRRAAPLESDMAEQKGESCGCGCGCGGETPPSDADFGARMNILQEFWLFLKENKAYWLAPILIVLLLLIGLVVAGSGSAAPFIYTLF